MKILIQNLATEYKDEGNGPVLLFLHGWQDSIRSFDALVPYLENDFRIIRLDLPGFGKTEFPKTSWDLDDYVSFVKKFTEKLDISPYAVAGHSFGGRIAIKSVSEKILTPEKLILIASAGIKKSASFKNRALKLFAKIGKVIFAIPPLSLFGAKIRNFIYKHIESDYLSAGALKETFIKIINEDLSASASNIAIPALLIWGDIDTATPLKDGEKLAHLIKRSGLKVFQNVGHFVHVEKPKETAEAIFNFLKQDAKN